MAVEKFPMTLNGYERLQEELKKLKSVERRDVINAIAKARLLGDLSENAEYHAARERQSFVEGRIAELEAKIAYAEVIEVSKLSGTNVVFGSTVSVTDEDSDEEMAYQIVGMDEADIKSGLLSISSPLARALIGKKVDDSVMVKTPKGEKHYTINSIKFI